MTKRAQAKKNNFYAAAALLAALAASPSAFAACTTPAGNEGDVNYSSSLHVMVYCNGTSWIGMGVTQPVSFGTLTQNDFCTATSASAIACTTAAINLASQVSGTLPTTNGGTGLASYNKGDILYGSAANTLSALPIGSSGYILTASAGGLPVWSAAPASGVTSFAGGSTGLTPATATTGAVTLAGTLGVANGGTGAISLAAHTIVLGEGTATVGAAGVGATGTVLIGNTGADPTFSTSPTLTNMTLSGVETLTFGADYSTTGVQNNVNLTAVSSVRYTGGSTATFTGIIAGTANVPGEILTLHNASSSTLTLANQSASSTASNEIITGTGANLVMAANSSVVMQYDGTASRWRVIGGSGGGIPAGTTGQVQFNTAGAFNADTNLTWDNTNKLLSAGTGAAAPAATTGTIAGNIVNVIPQAVSYSVGSLTGGISLNPAATGQMAYYSAAATISGTPNLYVSGTNIGIGTSTATNLLSLSGSAAQTIWMERGATVGNSLTVQAGGGLSGGSNETGGTLILASGISTGTGTSQIQFKVYPGVAAATTDNTATTAMTITSGGNVGIGTTTSSTTLTVNGTATAAALAGAWDNSASGYVRIGNMQIAWGTSSGIAHTGLSGSVYYGTFSAITYPAAFKSGTVPVVHVSADYAGDGVFGCEPNTPTSTAFAGICFASASGTTGVLRYTAIGVWQ